eukprot:TRINITY_DN112411_c0_g1_i1.p1 TRINITY_DN112411_c0_g1~~TRINITY_DN112411_c0_g1_i1.p1  ORF type:complete len:401 (+),score=96.96 TRINITY_DN112411_c0_g1_i1:22-1203(+)
MQRLVVRGRISFARHWLQSGFEGRNGARGQAATSSSSSSSKPGTPAASLQEDSSFKSERHEGSAAAAAACPEGDEQLADMRVGALRMMQHGAGRARDRERALLRRAAGRSSNHWITAGGVEDQSKEVRRSNIEDRKFLTNDGAEGRNQFERERSASRMRLQRSVGAAAEYRAGKYKEAGSGSGSKDDRDLEEIEQEVEETIQIAIANGEFDNLEGSGKPLKSLLGTENPFLDTADRVGFGLLQKHGFAPEWIEQQKKIHREIERLVRDLGESWAASCFEPTAAFVTQKDRFRRELLELNKQVRDYNLSCPSTAQMVPFELPDEVRRAKREAEARAQASASTSGVSRPSVTSRVRMTPLREVFAKRPGPTSSPTSSRSIWSRVADAFKLGSSSP